MRRSAHTTCQEQFPHFSLENLGGLEAVGRLSPAAVPTCASRSRHAREGEEGPRPQGREPPACCRLQATPPARSAQLCWLGLRGRVSPGGRVCGRAQRPGRGAAPTSVVKQLSPEPPAAPLPDLDRCRGGGRCCPPLVGGDLGRPCGTAPGRAPRISSSGGQESRPKTSVPKLLEELGCNTPA